MSENQEHLMQIRTFIARPSRPSTAAGSLLAVAVAAVTLMTADALAMQAPGAGQGAGQAQDGGGGGGGRGQGGGGGGGRGGMGRGMFGGMGRGMGIQNQFREAFEPDFVRRDIPFFKEQLTLEDAQMVVVEQLMRDYEDAFEPAREAMMEQMQDIGRQMMAPMMGPEMQQRWQETMQAARDQMEQMAAEKGGELTPEERQRFFREQMEKMGETVRAEMKTSGAFDQMRASLGEMVTDFNKWQDTKSKLRAGFVDGMKAALSEPQSQKWPSFERFLSREKTLPRSTISGEGVNLFIVLDEAGLSKETFAKLQPIMDEYELQLDAALKARNDFLGANEAKYLEAIQSGDSDAAKRFASRAMELRQKVREVNDRYREAICGQLEAADATRVRAAALAAGFERVYGSNRMKRAFEGALKLEGISQEVIDAIKALEAQYDLEVSPLNDRIAQEIRKEEPVRQTEEMVRVVGFMTGDVPMSQMFRGGRGGQGDPDAQSNKQRGEMNDSFMNRLEALLTPEQREQLPRGGRGGQGGGMGGMFGGGGGPIKLADMPEQAQERMKPFDKNNDGTIDDTEREAMIQEFRQRGGGFFGGGGNGGGGGRGGNGGNGGGRGGNGGQGGGQGGGGNAP
jgi:hypothetical protein